MKRILITAFFPVILLLISACKDEITNEIKLPEDAFTAQEKIITEKGWQEFEDNDYSAASSSFKSAISKNSLYDDAYNGLGWSYIKLDSLEFARRNLSLAIISSTNQAVLRDAYAGRSFVNLAEEKYSEAILDANYALKWSSNYYYTFEDYIFRHDFDITEKDLLIVKAESYYMMQEYASCFAMLQLIDETMEPDIVSDPEKMGAILEILKQSN